MLGEKQSQKTTFCNTAFRQNLHVQIRAFWTERGKQNVAVEDYGGSLCEESILKFHDANDCRAVWIHQNSQNYEL